MSVLSLKIQMSFQNSNWKLYKWIPFQKNKRQTKWITLIWSNKQIRQDMEIKAILIALLNSILYSQTGTSALARGARSVVGVCKGLLSRLVIQHCVECIAMKCPHIASNSSMRCLVFPCLIWRSVLYLSRPAFTFSAWRTSFWVFLVSSLAWASSELKA